MPHCTTNFAWYLGKFLVGFAGVLFLYVGFLKEKTRDDLQDMVPTTANEHAGHNCARSRCCVRRNSY
ncbi:hypothetical protein DMN91_005807 [Ooceraea biroi]|uniref:Uncharacterized protein n=1 Tax=Ooceraea biroi TaxID=2015173 RepID=A0A3L8DLX8_OOCBI|nr:hypothetical protein DMN91_005807 [Ooceraea biroi]